MIVPLTTGIVAVVALLVMAEVAARLVAAERRVRERDQQRFEAREREWTAERTELLDRLHLALGKPWGAPPPVATARPREPAEEIVMEPPAVDPALGFVAVPEEMLG